MLLSEAPSFQRWTKRAINIAIRIMNWMIFVLLDLMDFFLCIFYRIVDGFLEQNSFPCCCLNRDERGEEEISETLYERENAFRKLGLINLLKKKNSDRKKSNNDAKPRWTDCDCSDCISWMGKEHKLHIVVMNLYKDKNETYLRRSAENVIFIHGFLSSSKYWTETLFPNLQATVKMNYKLFALDLLGFGASPKPQDCLYRLKDHIEMIESSVIVPFQLDSFHLVAHSMGCVIALAMAAKYPGSVSSITLVAPPYFPSCGERSSSIVLKKLADRRIWPLLLFGTAVMSWYEHLGRTICFLICRNHRKWESVLKLLIHPKRNLPFWITDITKHTHHSAWRTMHNVVCGGAKLLDCYLEAINRASIPVTVIQGDRDQVVPIECACNMKSKLPNADLRIIPNANHITVLLGREKDFTYELINTWTSVQKSSSHEHVKKTDLTP